MAFANTTYITYLFRDGFHHGFTQKSSHPRCQVSVTGCPRQTFRKCTRPAEGRYVAVQYPSLRGHMVLTLSCWLCRRAMVRRVNIIYIYIDYYQLLLVIPYFLPPHSNTIHNVCGFPMVFLLKLHEVIFDSSHVDS